MKREKSPISGKKMSKLLLEIEEEESKKLQSFRKLLEYMNQKYGQGRQNQSNSGTVNAIIRKLANYSYLNIW